MLIVISSRPLDDLELLYCQFVFVAILKCLCWRVDVLIYFSNHIMYLPSLCSQLVSSYSHIHSFIHSFNHSLALAYLHVRNHINFHSSPSRLTFLLTFVGHPSIKFAPNLIKYSKNERLLNPNTSGLRVSTYCYSVKTD